MTNLYEYGDAIAAVLAGRTAADLESRTLDFKQEVPDAREMGRSLAEAAVCFANAVGGTIVVGVDDKASGPVALVGTTTEPDRVRRLIHERTAPPMTLDVRVDERFGARLLVIVVPEGIEVHQDTQGRAYRRVDAQRCITMSAADQARLRDERTGFDWSAQASERASADMSALAIAAARARLAALPDKRQDLARLSDRDLLRGLGVVDAGGGLLKAGEVLFCDPLAGASPTVLYQYRPTPGGEPAAVERISSPLILAFQRVLELVDARRNTVPITLPDGQQIHVADFPDLAVREAVANGVLHRDHRLAGPVLVDHSKTVLAVSSPGPLVAGVTPDNILTHPSKPRNLVLTAAFRVLGLAEETGRGVDRMYREMIRAGRDLPLIEDGIDGVRVSLVGGSQNTRIARYVAQLPEDERSDTDTMLVLFTLCTRRTTNAQALAPLLQKGGEEAEAVLRRLSADPPGILEPTRGTLRRAHPAYRLRGDALRALGPAVRYQRRTVDDIDRKVIDHVNEYSRITNKTIRNIFEVDVYQATGIIKDLVDREVLVKTSTQQRGPNIEYGPGRKFPGVPARSRRQAGRGQS